MIALLFWSFAAICYAMVEKLRMHHGRSIWRKVPATHFLGNESWWRKYAKAHWPKPEVVDENGMNKLFNDILNGTYLAEKANAHIFQPKWSFWKWYYKHFDIGFQERFPFSTTALVFLTDGHHLFQWMLFNSFALAMGATYHMQEFFHVEQWLITSLIFRIAFSLVFYLFFEEVLTARDKKVVREDTGFLPGYAKKQLES